MNKVFENLVVVWDWTVAILLFPFSAFMFWICVNKPAVWEPWYFGAILLLHAVAAPIYGALEIRDLLKRQKK